MNREVPTDPDQGTSGEGQVGLGVDIVEIARMKRIIERTPSFSQKVFSPEERAYCENKANPEVHYATRFAAKEAVLKALGVGFSRGIKASDVEVGRTSKGRPFTILHGRAKEIAEECGVLELPLSLSFTHHEAVACAMVITQDSVRIAEERIDPMEELAKQFKEARAILDEIDRPSAEDENNTSEAPDAESILADKAFCEHDLGSAENQEEAKGKTG